MTQAENRGDLLARLAAGTLLAMLILAPLFRSGKVPLAEMLLELLALLAIGLYFWGGSRWEAMSRWERGLLAALVAVPLLQLIPLPGLTRLSLPGQADYYSNLQLVGEGGMVTLTALPRETWLGFYKLLIPVAVFLLARALPVSWLMRLMAVVLAMAAVQAVLGLLQYGAGADSLWMLGGDESGGLSKGTWRGRNSYANFLDMALVVSLAMFFATLGRHRNRAGKETLRQKLVYLSTGQGHKAFVFGALAVLVLVAVVFSRSRAGIGLAMVGIVLAGVVFSRRIGGDNIYGLTGTVVSIALAFAIAIGLGPVWDRFAQKDPMSDGRWVTFEGVLEGIGQFFPLGSGGGTFEQTFRPFQDLSQASVTMNQAHNSYLEWLFTAGLLGALLIVAFLALFVVRWFTVWKVGTWGDFRYLQVGAGLAMLLTLMHEMVDFNLFVPANMVYFAFMAGVFFHPYEEPAPKVRQRRTPRVEEGRSRASLKPVAVEPASNPFLEED